MTTVVVCETNRGLPEALDSIFAPFGGVHQALPQRGGTLYIKPNGVHFAPHTYTDPRVLEAVLAYLRDHGHTRLAVMESCTGGNFTRLVFKINGYDDICRRYGARPVYLDEGPTVEVTLPGEGTPIRISRLLHDEVVQRDENLYLSLPKLKTHSMAHVTLGVKGQQAFPVDGDRTGPHTRASLHRRLAALYRLTRPDFCIIEGLNAVAHGHFPATALLEECLVPMDLLVGGPDTLAVDVVGARILGYELEEVDHLRLCAAQGLGEGDLSCIQVQGVDVEQFTRRLPHTLLRRFHPDVRIVEGRERACVEGCRGNSEIILEILTNDYAGRGGWSLIFGRGFEPADVEDLPGDILLVGPCAMEELESDLRTRYPDRRIYCVPDHNDLMLNTRYQARLAGVTPVRMVPLNPVAAALTLLQARLRGLSARVPPLLG